MMSHGNRKQHFSRRALEKWHDEGPGKIFLLRDLHSGDPRKMPMVSFRHFSQRAPEEDQKIYRTWHQKTRWPRNIFSPGVLSKIAKVTAIPNNIQ
jgi:hypothetical protein